MFFLRVIAIDQIIALIKGLEQLAQHQGDAQGRDREAEALHKEADQAEGDHHKALEDVVVDGERAHHAHDHDAGGHDGLGDLRHLGEQPDAGTALDEHKDVGQIMPKVYYPNGDLQYICKLIPTPLDLIFKRFFPSSITERRMYKFQLRFTGYNRIMNVPYLSGCFMLFRMSALQDIGLFDERFFMYPEDIDITRRMHEKYKTIFFPKVSIIHAHAAASKVNIRMLKVHILNMVRYFNKWGWILDSKRRKLNKQVLRELQSINGG